MHRKAEDKEIWIDSKSGNFSTKLLYSILESSSTSILASILGIIGCHQR